LTQMDTDTRGQMKQEVRCEMSEVRSTDAERITAKGANIAMAQTVPTTDSHDELR
jgi:hypothetical protein